MTNARDKANIPVLNFQSKGIDDNADATAITIDSSENVGIKNTTPSNFNASARQLVVGSGSGDNGITIFAGNTNNSSLFLADGTVGTNGYRGSVNYLHNGDALTLHANATETMRLSNGNVGIGNTVMASFSNLPATDLVVGAGTTNSGITIYSGTTHGSNIAFADGASGDARNQGIIQYHHNGDYMRFFTSASERMRLTSTGLGVGTSNPVKKLVASNSGAEGIEFSPGDSSNVNMVLNYNRSTSAYIASQQRASYHRFDIDTTEGMRLTSTGLGIGTTSPQRQLHVQGNDGASGTTAGNSDSQIFIDNDSGNGAMIEFGASNDGAGRIMFSDEDATNRGKIEYIHSSDHMQFSTANTERMRINSSGDVVINRTAPYVTYKMTIDHLGLPGLSMHNDTGNNTAIGFYNGTDGNVLAGYISVAASGTATVAYNTSSDYRLKENVNYTWDATTRLKQLKPARFNWIADENNTVVDGFLAHEVSDAVPEAINGTKDAVDEDGNPQYQGIDQSKLVPLLVKTIQELEARITTLEANNQP